MCKADLQVRVQGPDGMNECGQTQHSREGWFSALSVMMAVFGYSFAGILFLGSHLW